MEALGSNVTNLQEVIFFLLPGFLTILLFYYQVPDRRKSDLTITILSVIASVVLTYLTALVFGIINLVFQLSFQTSGVGFDMTKIVLSILSAIVLARFVESGFFAALNTKIFLVEKYPFGRLWNTFFRTRSFTVVKVILQDGRTYIGSLKRASFDPNDDVQELELADPYNFDLETGEIFRVGETERVLILGTAIASVEKIREEEAKKLYIFPSTKKRKK